MALVPVRCVVSFNILTSQKGHFIQYIGTLSCLQMKPLFVFILTLPFLFLSCEDGDEVKTPALPKVEVKG
jgi:hypothetical protein